MAEEEIVYPLDEERAQKAYDALVKYLALSARSEQECKNKLYDKGYHKNEVEYALERAKNTSILTMPSMYVRFAFQQKSLRRKENRLQTCQRKRR